MYIRLLLVPILSLAASATAQEGEIPAKPEPTAEHKLLKDFEGIWRIQIKHWANPDAEPQRSEAVENTQIACGGLWLISRCDAALGNAPFQGRGLSGYDPLKKKFVSYWVDSMSPRLAVGEGTYDAKTKTLTSALKMPGPDGNYIRCKCVATWKDQDTRVETISGPGPDGEEFVMMELTMTRAKDKAVAEAVAKRKERDEVTPSLLAKQHEHLKAHAGTWNAAVKMEMPGQDKPTESTGTCTEALDCGGLFILTEFRGEFMGPFEGRGIFGYDPVEKQFFSVWVDSMSPHAAISKGTIDETGVLTLEGSSIGMDGKPVKTRESVGWEGKDKRVFTMKSTTLGGEDAGKMVITYTRRK